ncbi:hypothetical protein Sm713_46970 [Streptomyces sp. TS71-3]|nr:hypothetical protein Sm713_46970 [Streptomyces sp. TS71-3]
MWISLSGERWETTAGGYGPSPPSATRRRRPGVGVERDFGRQHEMRRPGTAGSTGCHAYVKAALQIRADRGLPCAPAEFTEGKRSILSIYRTLVGSSYSP